MSTPTPQSGWLILNADDWGRDQANTDRALDCFAAGALSSVSAMVFMEDSARSTALAREHGIDAGLHLNLTAPFTGPEVSTELAAHQSRIAAYLLSRRVAQALYHPGLAQSFAYSVRAQLEEYERLYGSAPRRIDGHHHMHLAANVMFTGLLPQGGILRRNFSFEAGEKSALNRGYRRLLDTWLGRRHRLTDHFISLPPLEPKRLERMARLARTSIVEAETHPVNPEEHRFLSGGQIFKCVEPERIARGFPVRS